MSEDNNKLFEHHRSFVWQGKIKYKPGKKIQKVTLKETNHFASYEMVLWYDEGELYSSFYVDYMPINGSDAMSYATKEIGYYKGVITEGVMHKDDGPAFISDIGLKSEERTWFKLGKVHRLDGPAIESEPNNMWLVEGSLHREDGPAVVYNKDFRDYPDEYWLEDKEYSYRAWVEKLWPNLTKEEKKNIVYNGFDDNLSSSTGST